MNQEDKVIDIKKAMFHRSLLRIGNDSKIKSVLDKSRRGEEITIVFLGGSITEHYLVDKEDSFVRLICQYIEEEHGMKSNVNYYNIGMSGTTSLIGLIRVQEEVLERKPDIVFLEYAVNDFKENLYKEIFESLVIRILQSETEPSIILLSMITKAGYTCQGHMQVIGEHYDLPMISIGNAIMPEIKEHRMEWEDFSSDYIHPNKYGHTLIKDCIINYLKMVETMETHTPTMFPQTPIFGNAYVNMKLLTSKNLEAIDYGDFMKQEGLQVFQYAWKHIRNKHNKSIQFKITCQHLFVIYKENNQSSEGTAKLFVDGVEKLYMHGYSVTGWGNPVAKLAFTSNTEQEHLIEIMMSSGDELKDFTLLCFGCC